MFFYIKNISLFIIYLNVLFSRDEVVLRDDKLPEPYLLGSTRILQMVGSGSPFIEDTLTLSSKLDLSKSEWAKVN